MGCGDVFNDVTSFISDPIHDATGLSFGTTLANPLEWDHLGDSLKSDWSKFKHLLVPDLRKDREVQIQSATNSRNLVYGRTRVGNQFCYGESSGASNSVFHIVCVHAGHEIDGYEEIYFDDKLVATAADGWTIRAPYTGKATIEFFDGTQTAASSTLVAASSGQWTADHKLLGVSYTHITLTYNEAVYVTGCPSVKAVIRGKKIFDPRTGVIAWSDNPALCIRDYMVMPVEQGGMGCEADEINEASFATAADICDQLVQSNIPSNQEPGVKTVAKVLPGGPAYNEKRYSLNGEIRLDGAPTQFVRSMLTACAGEAVYTAGEWKIFAGAPMAAVATIDESWLNGGISFQTGANKNDKANTAKGTYTNSNDYWADTEFPPVPVTRSTPPNSTYWSITATPDQYSGASYAVGQYVVLAGKVYLAYTSAPAGSGPPNSSYWILVEPHDVGASYVLGQVVQRAGVVYTSISAVPASNPYLTEDNGEVLTANLTLPFTITSSAAQRLAKIELEKTRRGLALTYPCNHKAFTIDVMDVVAVNNDRLGWVGKLFRVVSWSFSLMGGTSLSLAEYDGAIYDWVPGDSTPLVPPIITNLPDPWTVAAPTGLTVTESLYVGNVASAVKCKAVFAWTPGEAQSTVYDIYLDGIYLATIHDTTIDIFDIAPGVHLFAVVASNTLGVRSSMITQEQTIFGKTAPPGDVPWIVIQGRRVDFGSVSDLDVVGYEVRYQSNWDFQWNLASRTHQGIVFSPFTMPSLPPNNYTIMVKALDSSGNYSNTPAFGIATYIDTNQLGDRPVANVVETFDFAVAGWPGELTGGAIIAGDIVADAPSNMWADDSDYEMWNYNSGNIMFDGSYADMIYLVRFSVTESQANSQMTVVTDLTGTHPSIQYRPTGPGPMWSEQINNPMWSAADTLMWQVPDFMPWPGAVNSNVDFYEFRLSTGFGPTPGSATSFSAIIDVPDLEELLNDVVISASGSRLPITKTFRSIKTVILTMQADAGYAVRASVIDKSAALGPMIETYNGSGTRVSGTIDARIQGY